MNHSYLVQGANVMSSSIKYINTPSYSYDRRSLSLYFSAACKTLEQLLEDEKTILKIAECMDPEVSRDTGDLKTFLDEFSKLDSSLLELAGMEKRAIKYLLKDIHVIGEKIRNKELESLSDGTLHSRIAELKNSACSEVGNFQDRRNTLWRCAHVIGGSAIVVTNFSADTIIGGLASLFSQTVGGALVGEGLSGLTGQIAHA